MKFEKYPPCEFLKPYIKYFVCSETSVEQTYTISPDTSIVIGFQYVGGLSFYEKDEAIVLSNQGITGILDSFRIFKNVKNTGSVLIYFTEMGAYQFLQLPVNELFAQSISLEYLFKKSALDEVENRLFEASADTERIAVVEDFLINQFKEKEIDRLVQHAVQHIHNKNGMLRITDLAKELYTSQSPLEKKFRKIVGTTPKKYASIVRFKYVLEELSRTKNLTELGYAATFFDQSHFIKDFKKFTNETPNRFLK